MSFTKDCQADVTLTVTYYTVISGPLYVLLCN